MHPPFPLVRFRGGLVPYYPFLSTLFLSHLLPRQPVVLMMASYGRSLHVI